MPPAHPAWQGQQGMGHPTAAHPQGPPGLYLNDGGRGGGQPTIPPAPPVWQGRQASGLPTAAQTQGLPGQYGLPAAPGPIGVGALAPPATTTPLAPGNQQGTQQGGAPLAPQAPGTQQGGAQIAVQPPGGGAAGPPQAPPTGIAANAPPTQDGSGITPATQCVVVSTAVEETTVEYVKAFSLGIPILQRSDLLPRLARLQDRAGYHGEDTLVEDLLKAYLPDREDLDQWFHDVSTPLIRAIYTEDPDEPRELLVEYCNQWYEAFEQAPWHDSHLDGDEGSYFGYWAFEAAAVAYLYGLDDSAVKHMIFPREMLDYARRFTPPPIPQQAAQD